MKKKLALLIFTLFIAMSITAQNVVKGIVLDSDNENPINGVEISVKGTQVSTVTNENGVFIVRDLANGSYIIEIKFTGYESQNFPINLNGNTIDLGSIYLYKALSEEEDISIINITDDELNGDDGFIDNVAGLLQSSRDVYLRAAAFDFSATFFRPRGLDNANGKVLINGIEMNKLDNGRPQWANWGGMNDFFGGFNVNFSMGLNPSENVFGDIAGVNSISVRASDRSPGGRVSFSSANRSYRGRMMASYSSGLTKGGWAYSFLVSRRFGNEGFVDGTLYDANSFFASVEKKIGKNHSINFNSIYAYNRRGRSTFITDEIFQLKGRRYNPFWGEFNGEIRNSRERVIEEPILMLNHYWNISDKTTLNTNVAYQFGSIGNTRIDNGGTRLVTFNGQDVFIGGARNPTPEFFQNLPSFFLQDPNPTAFDFQQAFLARESFVNDGQLNWNDLILANQSSAAQGGNSIYALQEDRIDDKQLTINSILFTELNDNIRLNASVSHRSLRSENYAQIKDLLGGTGYLDVDFFAEEDENPNNPRSLSDVAQSDLQNPNRIARQGDRYRYNYDIDANITEAFVQAQFNYSKVDFYVAGSANRTTYQRTGLFENGNYPGARSLGPSEELEFNNFSAKGGITYKITGQHLLDFNAGYLNKAPNIRNSFENARQNNSTVLGLESENIVSFDASYIWRAPGVQARLSGYHTMFKNGTDINFFFTEDLSTFAQEIVTNIERRNFGGELGIEVQVTPTIKLKGVAGLGQFTFNNNPNVYYTSDDFSPNPNENNTERLTFGDGTANLKDLRVASGPERAFQLGFEYRDPDFWWIGATVNHFSHTFVDPSVLKRTSAFATDIDLVPEAAFTQGGNISGFAINDFDERTARQLLRQEQFDNFVLVNLVGGKSWRIGDYFVGFFATVNNLFNQVYRTGGFEQSRRVNYREQIVEQGSDGGPLFGNRYFYGNGTTYFINFYLRF